MSVEQDLLDAIAIPAAKGKYKRTAPELQHFFLRELGPGDLPALMAPEGKFGANIGTNDDLQKLRHTHHLLALLLAGGAKDYTAAAQTGYSPGTVARLKKSPMFCELVAYYSSQKEAEFVDFHRRAAALGLSALDELQARLEDAPDTIKFKDLMDLAEKLLDRTILPSKASALPQAPPAPPQMTIQFIDAPGQGQGAVTIEQGGQTARISR